MPTQRGVVDYALRRRSVLSAVTSGRTAVKEVCDADPYLVRAAKFHGVATDQPCPLCRKETVTNVYWVYGDELAHAAGTARDPAELTRMAGEYSEFSVYMVEICLTCSWNHLVQSFVLGHEGQRTPKRRSGSVK
ncbi:hypothetical protein EH165_15035 [Nakamurella antarctica]|uniref:DUF5318 domain-containing protein n=1 Tax=Nakamurella antarctica TaxID=1902245 RepID=A0A3G8ZQY3_9ACTN|nr:hypothetical protein EH165_15035 [Nakamurella antarctica]